MDAAEIARLRENSAKGYRASWDDVVSLLDALEQARAQLPEGMENCTIVFEECPKGHGNLRGTNWIKHPCMICQRDQAQKDAKDARPLLDLAAHCLPDGAKDLREDIEAMLEQKL